MHVPPMNPMNGLSSEWPMKILFVDIVNKVYEFL